MTTITIKKPIENLQNTYFENGFSLASKLFDIYKDDLLIQFYDFKEHDHKDISEKIKKSIENAKNIPTNLLHNI